MEFKNIKKAVSDELSKRYRDIKLDTEENLKKELMFYHKEYKGDFKTQKKKLLSFLNKRFEKQHKTEMDFINSVENAPDFKEPFIITIEWKKSNMWGMNPRSYTNEGFVSESIGGCGYDKKSTASAYALNSNLSILKLMYSLKEKELNNLKENYTEQNGFKCDNKNQRAINQELFGYGSGYNIQPRFEGGVGVECHERIINKIGLVWENVTYTDNTDVYRIAKK